MNKNWNSSWATSNPKRWCCESAALNVPANLKNSAVATGLEKLFSFQFQRKTMPKNVQTITQLHSSHVLQSNVQNSPSKASTENFQMFKLVLEKAKEQEIKLPTSNGSLKKQKSSRKTSISALLTMPKPLCGSQQTVENSSGDGSTKPPYMHPEKSVCRSKGSS